MTCSYVCRLQFLVGAVLLLCAFPSIYGDLEKSQTWSKCLKNRGSADVTATASWQIINALDLKAEAYRSCTISIQWQPVSTQPPVQPSPLMLLLLRIDSVQLGTSDMQCDASTSSLMLYASDSAQESYICHMSNVTYLWAASILNMYIQFVPRLVSGSIAVAFKLAPAANVCNMNGSELLVDSKVYVFAPDESYAVIPPNGDNLCQTGVNHSLSIIPANSSWALVLRVLAAPSTISCCLLYINRINGAVNQFNQIIYRAAIGEQLNIWYIPSLCGHEVREQKRSTGFTLEVDILNQPLPTDDDLNTVLIGSNTALVAALSVTAVVAGVAVLAFVIVRTRHSFRCYCLGAPREHSSHPRSRAEADLGSTGRSPGRPSAPARIGSENNNCAESHALAEFDIDMVENDLYEKSMHT